MSFRMNNPYMLSWDEEEAAERLLVGYAHGLLDEALSLFAEVYADLNDQARRHLEEMQYLCGALLEEMAPVAISENCRRNILAFLDDDLPFAPPPPSVAKPSVSNRLPEGLQDCMEKHCYEALQWRQRRAGLEEARLSGMPARVLRVQPGTGNLRPAPHMVHFTLVLDGALIKNGEMLPRGTLQLITPRSPEPVKACEDQGCVCLSTQESAGGIAGLLTRLLRDL